MTTMKPGPSIASPLARALRPVRGLAALGLLVLSACTSAPSSSTDFLVLESQKFT